MTLAARLAVLGLVLIGLAVPLFLDPQGYALRVLTLALLFAALGQAWNIVGGLANQISLGHAAFFGIGAYTSTILLRDYGITPWLGMLAGAALAALAAALLSVPTFRLKGHYFALATLAFAEVMRVIGNSWSTMTGGPVGISVPYAEPGFAIFQFGTTTPYYYICFAALALITLLFALIKAGRMGYRLRAIRENSDAAEVIGIDTFSVKLHASLMSAAITAALGTVYAQFNFFFDPDTVFGLAPISIRIALVAIIGGVGTALGPILGAFFLIPLEEFANAALAGRAAGLSQFAYGLLLIAVILVQPRGLVALFGGLRRGARRRGGAASPRRQPPLERTAP